MENKHDEQSTSAALSAAQTREFAQGGPAPIADAPDNSGAGQNDHSGAAGHPELPDGHWLTAEHPNIPPMPFRVGRNNLRLRLALAERIAAAGRYAVRCSTADGESFDPDALIQNLITGVLGYSTRDGLSDDILENPEAVRPCITSVQFESGEDLA